MRTDTMHTAGPWILQELPGNPGYPKWIPYAIRQAKSNVHLATVGNVDRYCENTQGANAALMASSPILYDALDRLANGMWPTGMTTGDMEQAVREIARTALSAIDWKKGFRGRKLTPTWAERKL